MKLIVKILQGNECVVEVNDDATVLEVKKYIHTKCEIPISKQRLLFLGKTLVDENKLNEYKTLKDGSKVYLVIKTPEPLDVALLKFFKQHYSQAEAEKYSQTVHTHLTNQISNMSWDDIERLSKDYIESDKLTNLQ